MVVNGDAETGPCAADGNVTRPTGWDYDGDITQLAYNNSYIYNRVNTIPATAKPGRCLFYGQTSANTSMWQTINLTEYTDSSLIDSETVKFNLSAWLGGYVHHNDRAAVSLTFDDQANHMVGNVTSIGPVDNVDRSNVTSFLFQYTTGLVPAGARSVTVLVVITRAIGPINDGYADDIGVFLYQ
ncbi:unnamed protein product [Rotaria sp. Silwood2]|nr:unnamed protein product [Rotaria sp. Silwood2]